MNGITSPEVEQYFYDLLPEREPVLTEMEKLAAEQRIPIVGPAVGRFLYQLAKMTGGRSVFELGSAIGYSTIWWAKAVGPNGRVVYTDTDPTNADRARDYFRRSGVQSCVQVEVGDALEVLEREAGPFDIIFNDVDKKMYPRVFPLAIPKLRPGGLFVTDNVLWSGKVAKPVPEQDDSTRAITEFNRMLYSSTELWTTIMPLRDGVAVCWKKGE